MTRTRSMSRALSGCIILLASVLLLLPAARAQESTPEAALDASMENDTFVRFVNLSSGVGGGVDVNVGETALDTTDLTAPGVTGWMPFTAGSYNIDVLPRGGSAADAISSLPDQALGPGLVTVVLVDSQEGQPTAFVVNTSLEENLLPGTSGLTLVNGLSDGTTVNFDRDDVPFATELGEDRPVVSTPVDSGTYTFRAYNPFAENGGTLAEQEVELVEGSSYVIAVVGTAGSAQLFVDETTGAELAMARGILQEPGRLSDALESDDLLSVYVEMFQTTGLTETLDAEGPHTVFMPADYLMDEITAAAGSDTDLLTRTLRNQIVEGHFTLQELIEAGSITTLEGNTYEITVQDNTIFVNGVRLLTPNIFATNGVIHVIDGVLPLSGQAASG